MPKLSDIASGSSLNSATDKIVVVRNGNTDELVTLGTSATKAASGSGGTVSSVSGTTTPGHLAAFADTAGTVQDAALGVNFSLSGSTLVSTMEFADYATITAGVDATTALQNFRIAGFITAVLRGALNKGNLAWRVRVKQRCMAGYPLTIYSPDVIPPFVDSDSPLQLLRAHPASGTAGAFYNGDPASNAFLNLAMPTVFVSLYGHMRELSLNAAPDGTHIGAAIAGPRYWTLNSSGTGFSVGSQGAGGYTNGDVVTASIGGLPSPFIAPTFSLTVVGGNVTGLTLVNVGALPMPPKMLRKAMGDPAVAWANPVTGGPTWATCVAATATTKATAVFDVSSNYLTTGGTGSGLTINIADDTTAWNPDFSAGAATYLFQVAQCNSVFGNILTQGVSATTDATYGPIMGWVISGDGHFINSFYGGGGYYGLYSNAVDLHLNSAHITDAWCSFKIAAGGNFECPQLICDSPTDHYLEIDSCEGIQIKGRCFNNGPDLTGAAAILIGSHSTASSINRNHDINYQLNNAGTATGIPAASIAYIQASRINLDISNIESKTGATASKRISSFAAFGSGVGSNNIITGKIDGVFGQIYSGTLPHCYLNIWDAEVPLQYGSVTATFTGTATNSDIINLALVNNAIPGWGVTSTSSVSIGTGSKSFTIPAGLSYPASTPIVIFNGVNAMIGAVTSYTQLTGVLVVNVTATTGSGTLASWTLTTGVASVTVTTSETTTQMATAVAAAINAASSLTSYGVSATSNAGVVTICQSGSQANNTVVTSYVAGAATEVVTLSNSGAISGAISGGTFKTGGIYEMVGNGIPVSGASQSTGLNKAGKDSLYTDLSGGLTYVNTASASSPAWSIFNPPPAVVTPKTSRFYAPHCFSGLGTAVQVNSAGNAVATCVPFYLSAAMTPVSLACEVTTGSTTGGFNISMGIYTDNGGKPGTLLVDIGTTSTGVITVAQAATGVQIQAIPAANQSVLQPGWYWLGMISTIPTSAGSLAFKALQNNTTYTRGMIGDSLTQGSASPSVASGSYINNTSSNTAVLPASVSTLGTAGTSPVAIWIGF
jgi:hypothetical protein